MTLERRRPLPAGRYWADIFPQNRAAWSAWISLNQNSGKASLVTTEHTPEIAGAPEHDFVIFTTSDELVWPDEVMGFSPNVAGANVTSSDDTIDKPEPQADPLDQFGKLTQGIYAAGAIAAGLIVLVGVFSLARGRR